MACELRGGTPRTDALPTPTDWAKIYLEQLSEKNLRIAELEAALRQIVDGPGRPYADPGGEFEMFACGIAYAVLQKPDRN
jgi:hypothetical protein